jgi:hypothetical protein
MACSVDIEDVGFTREARGQSLQLPAWPEPCQGQRPRPVWPGLGPGLGAAPAAQAISKSSNYYTLLNYLNILCIFSYYYALLYYYCFNYLIDSFITIISYYTYFTKNYYTNYFICIIHIIIFK